MASITVTQAVDANKAAVPGSALVTWTSATSSTGVTYTVYYQATNSPLAPVMYTRCGLKATAINAGVQAVSGPTIKGAPMTQVIPGLTQTQTYYFNVIVEDVNGNYWAYTHTSPISLVCASSIACLIVKRFFFSLFFFFLLVSSWLS